MKIYNGVQVNDFCVNDSKRTVAVTLMFNSTLAIDRILLFFFFFTQSFPRHWQNFPAIHV